MEIRQLRYFVKLAETLNFSTAAKELFITQSTLSHQILQLENELQQPLFLRNSHEVSLTEAGQTLLPLAKETLHSADNCLLRLEELKSLAGGELNIGVTFSFATIMAEVVTAFLRKYPHVKVNVTQSTMAELMAQLENHELDFVLAFKLILRLTARYFFTTVWLLSSASTMPLPAETASRLRNCNAMTSSCHAGELKPAMCSTVLLQKLAINTGLRWR